MLTIEYWPLGHELHTRSTVADGVLPTKVLAGQIDHATQAAALVVALHDPLAQAAQVRSLVALPSDPTKVPGRHEVFATHGVAALWSLYQAPATQVTGSTVPPTQYCPAAQAVHTAGEVGVPTAVWTVPAPQVPCGWHDVWLLLAENWPAAQAAHVRLTVVEGVLAT